MVKARVRRPPTSTTSAAAGSATGAGVAYKPWVFPRGGTFAHPGFATGTGVAFNAAVNIAPTNAFSGIDATGATDVTAALLAAIHSFPDGTADAPTIITFPPGAIYQVDSGPLTLTNRHHMVIDHNGATLRQQNPWPAAWNNHNKVTNYANWQNVRNRGFWSLYRCTDITIKNWVLDGINANPGDGAEIGVDEQIRVTVDPTVTSFTLTYGFDTCDPIAYTPTATPLHVHDVLLGKKGATGKGISGFGATTHAGLSVTGPNGGPYTIGFTPLPLPRGQSAGYWTVTAAVTGGTGNVTVTRLNTGVAASYNADFESQHGFSVQACDSITLAGITGGKVLGDQGYFQVDTVAPYANNTNIYMSDIDLAHSGRMGMTFNGIVKATLENFALDNSGRSMFDIEPNSSRGAVDRLTIRNGWIGHHHLNFIAGGGGAGMPAYDMANHKGIGWVTVDHLNSSDSLIVDWVDGNHTNPARRGPFIMTNCNAAKNKDGTGTSSGQYGTSSQTAHPGLALRINRTDIVIVQNNVQPLDGNRAPAAGATYTQGMTLVGVWDCTNVVVNGNTVTPRSGTDTFPPAELFTATSEV